MSVAALRIIWSRASVMTRIILTRRSEAPLASGRMAAPSAADRPHDVVLFGATGFTGELTARYLAAHAPSGTRVALAGRSREKLAALRDRLADDVPAAGQMPLLQADVGDASSVREIAEAARVVATTVGPYINHGDPLVAACAAAGTDYADLTGEPEFVDRTYLRHHATAVDSGARLVHACGFDSIPHDLGAQFTVEHLPEGVPLTVEGFVRAGGSPSAGTYHSAVTAFSRARHYAKVSAERRRRDLVAGGRRLEVVQRADVAAHDEKRTSVRGAAGLLRESPRV